MTRGCNQAHVVFGTTPFAKNPYGMEAPGSDPRHGCTPARAERFERGKIRMKMNSGKKAVAAGLLAAILACPALGNEGPVPKGIPHLDHVFVIMMENHSYSQIVKNPNAPFANQFANSANRASNYFAIAHPSLTN